MTGAGDLIGTTESGGTADGGTVFDVPIVEKSAATGTELQQTVGVFDPNNAIFHLSNPGMPDIAFQYGGIGWKPFAGDFNHSIDGTVTDADNVGVFDPSNAVFHLNFGAGDYAFQYGGAYWDPLAGNFFNDVRDSVGVFDPSNAVFHLSQDLNNPGPNDYAFQYGGPGWKPFVGNFFGTGYDTVGVFDPNNGVFHLSNVLGNPGSNDYAFFYNNHGSSTYGWVPFAGDFTGSGKDTVGLYDPTNSIFHIITTLPPRYSYATDSYAFQYGGSGWAPVIGDWDYPTLPQLAAGGEARVPSGTAALTNGQLQTEVQAALNLLATDGMNSGLLARLGSLQFTVGQLPAGYLGLSDLAMSTVEISADAVGYGWFVDPNPLLDQAFSNGVAQPGSAAVNRMDLLTVVLHEMGHFDGWTELDPATHPDALMALTLGTGLRRIQDIDAVFGSAQG